MKKIINIIGYFLIFLIFCLFIVPSCKKNNDVTTERTKTKNHENAEIKKDSVLGTSGTTPCDLTFDYKFRIVTSGPVYEKFPGIPNTIYYDGLHDNPVGNRYAGPVHFESADPNNPHINITVWHLLY